MTNLSHFVFCGRSYPTARERRMLSRTSLFVSARPATRAFSLVEMIAVMAIVVIMLALLTPAVSSFTSTAGRTGAVNILMNTAEQARVAALESGRTVYVVFNRRIFPEQDEIAVLREPDPEAPASAGDSYEALTRWIKLPKGVLLHSLNKPGLDILSVAPTSGGSGTKFDPSRSPLPLNRRAGEEYNVLAFNGYGGISFPNSAKLMLFVSEGVRGEGGNEALISANKERAGGFEIISFRRYTGRASLEVTTL